MYFWLWSWCCLVINWCFGFCLMLLGFLLGLMIWFVSDDSVVVMLYDIGDGVFVEFKFVINELIVVVFSNEC